jgi:hypothetical protein
MPAAFLRPEPGKGFLSLNEITVTRFDYRRRRFTRRELGKDVISSGSQWAWLVFAIQDRKRESNAWEPPAFLFTAWKRKDRIWEKYADFKLPSKYIAKVLATLSYWNAALPDLVEKADAADKKRGKQDPLSAMLGVNSDALWRDIEA